MKRKQKFFCACLLLAAVLTLLCGGTAQAKKKGKSFAKAKTITNKLLDSMNLDKVDNVMIVAHPDDETLWGGGHLIEGNYLVVCLTNAQTPQYGSRRANEFKSVMEKTGSKGIIMYYPDYTGSTRIRDNWASSKAKIKKDLITLLQYKDWKRVVTYDKKGAYGHQHHKMTCALVTECFNKVQPSGSTLTYFGKYYSTSGLQKVKKKLKKLGKSTLKKKREVLALYKSQNVKKFMHMVPYENWKDVKTCKVKTRIL